MSEPRVQIIDGEPQPLSELIPPVVQRLVARQLDAPTGNGVVLQMSWFVPYVATPDAAPDAAPDTQPEEGPPA